MKKFFLAGSLIYLLISCDQIESYNENDGNIVRDNEGKIVSGTVKQYKKNKVLYAIRNVKDYKLDGKSTIFYKDGKTIRSIVYYNMGKKNGEAKTYYSNGSIYKEYNYKDGLLDGKQVKYRQNGNIRSIAYYRNGEPGSNLKEYLTNGELKKKYPKIAVETIDKTLLTGDYIVSIHMSDKSKDVTYYMGKLDKDGFISDDAMPMGRRQNGVLELKYRVLPGQYLVEKLELIAKVKTFQHNYYITTKTYNIAFENRVQ